MDDRLRIASEQMAARQVGSRNVRTVEALRDADALIAEHERTQEVPVPCKSDEEIWQEVNKAREGNVTREGEAIGQRYRVTCSRCGKQVSNAAPPFPGVEIITRAWVECPECTETTRGPALSGILTEEDAKRISLELQSAAHVLTEHGFNVCASWVSRAAEIIAQVQAKETQPPARVTEEDSADPWALLAEGREWAACYAHNPLMWNGYWSRVSTALLSNSPGSAPDEPATEPVTREAVEPGLRDAVLTRCPVSDNHILLTLQTHEDGEWEDVSFHLHGFDWETFEEARAAGERLAAQRSGRLYVFDGGCAQPGCCQDTTTYPVTIDGDRDAPATGDHTVPDEVEGVISAAEAYASDHGDLPVDAGIAMIRDRFTARRFRRAAHGPETQGGDDE